MSSEPSQLFSIFNMSLEDVKNELERLLSCQATLRYPPRGSIDYSRFSLSSSPISLFIPLKLFIKNLFPGVEVKVSPSINVLSEFLDEWQAIDEFQTNLLVNALKETKKVLIDAGVGLRSIAFIEISYHEDPEIEDLKKIFISFKIRSKDFSELQRLWDRIIDMFYKGLPLSMANKIVIEVEPGD